MLCYELAIRVITFQFSPCTLILFFVFLEKMSAAEVAEGVEAMSVKEALYTSESRGSDEAGEGTYKVPYKTIMQAMKRYGKEPFPVIYQDPTRL